ncbi:MAG: DsrE family protein [Prolixibacteraceae bacterium]|jgi:hypothetical protein|nr:DsrE family protein [Prolixibacteraceae bacterium]
MKHLNAKLFLLIFTILVLFLNSKAMAQNETKTDASDKLVVVWTSDDPYVAERVALMYTHAAKTNAWFTEVTLIIWGPSAKLTAENFKIQEKLKTMQKDGVVIEACIACATAYNVVDDLKKLDFDVKGMGKPLSDYLKSGAKVITF